MVHDEILINWTFLFAFEHLQYQINSHSQNVIKQKMAKQAALFIQLEYVGIVTTVTNLFQFMLIVL